MADGEAPDEPQQREPPELWGLLASIDIFSCRRYDPEVVARLVRGYFGGSQVVTHLVPRR